MSDPTKELIFQNEVVAQMVAGGWKRGKPENYDRALALYPEDTFSDHDYDHEHGFGATPSSRGSGSTLRLRTAP